MIYGKYLKYQQFQMDNSLYGISSISKSNMIFVKCIGICRYLNHFFDDVRSMILLEHNISSYVSNILNYLMVVTHLYYLHLVLAHVNY